jgi:hypothetical protein
MWVLPLCACLALALPAIGGCNKSKSGDPAAASAIAPSEPPSMGTLAKVTPQSLDAAAKKAGYAIKATRKTKTDMPGVALSRLSLEQGGQLAFVDFYDFSRVGEGEGKPHAKLGTKRAIYLRVQTFDDDSPESSAKLLGALLSKKPIDELTIADLKSLIGGQGWSLEGSAEQPDADLPGVRGSDFSGEKQDDSLDVVVIDFSEAASKKTITSARADAHRLLLVAAGNRQASDNLAALLTR